jgi:hypothetical protein
MNIFKIFISLSYLTSLTNGAEPLYTYDRTSGRCGRFSIMDEETCGQADRSQSQMVIMSSFAKPADCWEDGTGVTHFNFKTYGSTPTATSDGILLPPCDVDHKCICLVNEPFFLYNQLSNCQIPITTLDDCLDSSNQGRDRNPGSAAAANNALSIRSNPGWAPGCVQRKRDENSYFNTGTAECKWSAHCTCINPLATRPDPVPLIGKRQQGWIYSDPVLTIGNGVEPLYIAVTSGKCQFPITTLSDCLTSDQGLDWNLAVEELPVRDTNHENNQWVQNRDNWAFGCIDRGDSYFNTRTSASADCSISNTCTCFNPLAMIPPPASCTTMPASYCDSDNRALPSYLNVSAKCQADPCTNEQYDLNLCCESAEFCPGYSDNTKTDAQKRACAKAQFDALGGCAK